MPPRTVAALYVDRRDPYFDMPGVDPWDRERDATTYSGPHPVVAHPPCGPWGRLRRFCTLQDPTLALRAVDQVRAHGGVLEHPWRSGLWAVKGMPYPGDLWEDAWGGWSLDVRQVAWGHKCEKRTWLYLVGVPRAVQQEVRTGGAPTHVITTSRHGPGLPKITTSWEGKITPPAFAAWLVSLARRTTIGVG